MTMRGEDVGVRAIGKGSGPVGHEDVNSGRGNAKSGDDRRDISKCKHKGDVGECKAVKSRS